MKKNTKRFEMWDWRTSFAIIDFKKDGQVIAIYKTKKSCRNKVWDLNNSKSQVYIESEVKRLIDKKLI
tara:strand:+ start:44 stop:247 length:204 start_codon:yes stop_codon:yes gene_type:complete